jgi:hypothetical protein
MDMNKGDTAIVCIDPQNDEKGLSRVMERTVAEYRRRLHGFKPWRLSALMQPTTFPAFPRRGPSDSNVRY